MNPTSLISCEHECTSTCSLIFGVFITVTVFIFLDRDLTLPGWVGGGNPYDEWEDLGLSRAFDVDNLFLRVGLDLSLKEPVGYNRVTFCKKLNNYFADVHII